MHANAAYAMITSLAALIGLTVAIIAFAWPHRQASGRQCVDATPPATGFIDAVTSNRSSAATAYDALVDGCGCASYDWQVFSCGVSGEGVRDTSAGGAFASLAPRLYQLEV